MFKHSYVAKVGFVKTFDRTCPNCSGMYSSNERNACPKCGAALVIPTRQVEGGHIPMMFTEVVLYPMETQEEKDYHADWSKRAGGFPFEIRMTLYGRYDKERNMIFPDGRVQYLLPKRSIFVEFNSRPLVKPFVTRENEHKLEFKYRLVKGDTIKFLDGKATYDALSGNKATTPPANNNPNPTPPANTSTAQATPAMDMNALMAQVASLAATVANLQKDGARMPSPPPKVMTNASPEITEYPLPDGDSLPPTDMDMSDDGIGKVDPFAGI